MEFAVIGFGNRGKYYTDIALRHCNGAKLTAVCDISDYKRELARREYGVKEENIFSDSKDFFARGKLADILIIATMDRAHYKDTIKALEAGYNILLEKPISPFPDECLLINEKSVEKKAKISICHVLRYTPFFKKIKELLISKEIGDIVTLTHSENVGVFHQAHSFVRGNWRNSEESSPMILQKCCHDMDILRWLIDKPCRSVSSYGSLYYFKHENAPQGSADRCTDCKIDCIFNAEKYYNSNPGWYELISNGDKDVKKVLQTSPFGRCVYKCDNNSVDHQVTNLLFEGGVTAHLTMTAFSAEINRNIRIYGTKGEIEGDMEKRIIEVRIFGKEPYTIKLEAETQDFSGHGGGDIQMIIDFFKYIETGAKNSNATDITVSVDSHIMAFAAEESRLNEGKPVTIKA